MPKLLICYIRQRRFEFSAMGYRLYEYIYRLYFVRNHRNYGRDILEDNANDIRTILEEGFGYRLEARNNEIEANVQGIPSERSYQNAAFSSGLFTQLNAVNNQMTGTKAKTVPLGRKTSRCSG